MTPLTFASVLRLADGAFPSGAFSHSFGLETAIAAARVRDEATLFAWLEGYLVDAWATLDGAALVLALRDGTDALVLDDIVSAATNAPEVRAANARMARAACDAFDAMGCTGRDLRSYGDALRERRASGVPSVAFALAYGTLGVSWPDAFVACASATLTGLAAVGTRAIPLGQRATARVLWNLRDAVVRALARGREIEAPDELCSQAVPQEIDALLHRGLDGRLFAS